MLDALPLTARTSRTITSREQLLHELEQARVRGYAYDLEETAQGLCCVAAPIHDLDGHVQAAMSFCIPSTRFYTQQEYYAEIIVQATQSISEKLGYQVKSEKGILKASPGMLLAGEATSTYRLHQRDPEKTS